MSIQPMNSGQFRRWLAKRGYTFEEGKKHTLVLRKGKTAALPRHGGRKQLGLGVMKAIMQVLEIKD